MKRVVEAPDGRELPVVTSGDPAGKPVFLLHGTPGSSSGPWPRGIALYRLGLHLISYDRPGYPGSGRKKDRVVADAAYDVETIADFFGFDRFSVVGRSGGGPHALACAAILPKKVVCAAALGSLAPCDAEGFDWKAGMADSNIRAYRDAEVGVPILIATLDEQAELARGNSEGLLKLLWSELPGDDREVIGDIALRRKIAKNHADALHGTIDGWVDDVIALSRPWGFDPGDIQAPVKLWGASKDVFSPASHTKWLAKQIRSAELEISDRAAHFGAVEILPEILGWVAKTVDEEQQTGQPGPMVTASVH